MVRYFNSNDKCKPLVTDDLSEFLNQLSFHVNGVGTWKREKKTVANYTINDVEFIFYTSGESTTTILGTDHTCHTNDFMVLQPMQLYTSKSADNIKTEYQFIHFEVQPIRYLQPFLNYFQSAVTHVQHPERVLAIFQLIQQELKAMKPGYVSNINALIKMLSVEVIRGQDTNQAPKGTAAPASSVTELFVDQCIAYISNNLKGDCSVQTLSRHFSVSSNYIYKAFMKVLNESPSRYVTRMRMFRAKSLLLTDLLTIEEVAEEVGYPSLAHFSKVFKENLHCSPSEFRKQNQI